MSTKFSAFLAARARALHRQAQFFFGGFSELFGRQGNVPPHASPGDNPPLRSSYFSLPILAWCITPRLPPPVWPPLVGRAFAAAAAGHHTPLYVLPRVRAAPATPPSGRRCRRGLAARGRLARPPHAARGASFSLLVGRLGRHFLHHRLLPLPPPLLPPFNRAPLPRAPLPLPCHPLLPLLAPWYSHPP